VISFVGVEKESVPIGTMEMVASVEHVARFRFARRGTGWVVATVGLTTRSWTGTRSRGEDEKFQKKFFISTIVTISEVKQ
jgi:hypothetical protein